MDLQEKKVSKFLSLILRHKPSEIDLTLDANGWASTQDLLARLNAHDIQLTFEQLKSIVEKSDKQRFLFSADLTRIRASQGHSIEVDLQLQELTPPDELYHGTADKHLQSIKSQGLIKGSRHHVHLSSDKLTAKNVGARYGKPIVLVVDSKLMHKDGFNFFKSTNDIWLTEFVLPNYIKF